MRGKTKIFFKVFSEIKIVLLIIIEKLNNMYKNQFLEYFSESKKKNNFVKIFFICLFGIIRAVICWRLFYFFLSSEDNQKQRREKKEEKIKTNISRCAKVNNNFIYFLLIYKGTCQRNVWSSLDYDRICLKS